MAKTETPIRNEANQFVTLETTMGNMTLELYRDVAPAHADSFASLTKKGFYNNVKFHRIIDGFMIQGGDPTGTGTGNAGYTLKAEFSDLPHVDGTLSMARSSDPNSASCQFFICLGRAAGLDKGYTVFGHLVNGSKVLHALGKVPVGPQPMGGEKSRPLQDVKIIKAYLSDAEGKPLAEKKEEPKEEKK
ncbi:MAG: peptidylprolyl isomerase [bacterium]|nr:peptidylprolyl isomerase [bacterium]